LNEITEAVKSITPGVVGAASGVVYTRGHWSFTLATNYYATIPTNVVC